MRLFELLPIRGKLRLAGVHAPSVNQRYLNPACPCAAVKSDKLGEKIQIKETKE